MILNNVLSVAKNRFLVLLDRKNERLANGRKAAVLGDGTTRIYHYHVRKTGGTSLNHVFLSLDSLSADEVYDAMLKSPTRRFIGDKYVFVGWNKVLLERGKYSFGFSHIPFGQIKVPDPSYTITCLRDPKQRLISHFKMLLRYSERSKISRGMRRELRWLDKTGGIISTLRNMPNAHLLNQLYMFSTNLNVDEALENISTVDSILMTETLGEDVRVLGERFGVQLEPKHVRQDRRQVELSDNEVAFLDELLEPEYEFLRNISKNRSCV